MPHRFALRYGPGPGQAGELYLPDPQIPAPVAVLLHGGFWRMPHGRDQMDGIAQALAAAGFATWNLGYRRCGVPGVGWREACTDVLDGIACLSAMDAPLELDRIVLVGHSAGGQLALWAAGARERLRERGIAVRAVVGLAAVSDLEDAWALRLGNGAVAELMAAAPPEAPAAYREASPHARLPLGLPQVLLHGDADGVVPPAMSRRYVDLARSAGDDASLQRLAGAGHMDFLDPASPAFAAVLGTLRRLAGSA